MLLKNVDALVGDYLERRRVDIEMAGTFKSIRAGTPGRGDLDCDGLLAVPGLVNCHTHIGDSVGKDAVLAGTAEDVIHPVYGAKRRILGDTDPTQLASFMRATALSMVAGGTTTFVDFREGGVSGAALLKSALAGLPIRRLVLGRLDGNMLVNTPSAKQLKGLLRRCDGVGLSGANEHGDEALKKYSGSGGLRAIHAAETLISTRDSKRRMGRGEVHRALLSRPHFLVHMTHATPQEVMMAARKTRGIVVCPRANAALAEGIPDVAMMSERGCLLALGTDNVMINSPDMFREMDYIWKVAMGMNITRIKPRNILRMATVNAGILLGKKIGAIKRWYAADLVLLDKNHVDLSPVHDPYAAVVHRASASSVRAVIIGGKLVHGSV